MFKYDTILTVNCRMQPLKLAMVINVAIDDPVLVCLFDSICESCEGLADSITKKNRKYLAA